MGVYGVPETFVVGADGTIRYKQIGPLTPEAVSGPFGAAIEAALKDAAAKPAAELRARSRGAIDSAAQTSIFLRNGGSPYGDSPKATARISRRGQISVPKHMRETHHWTTGTALVLRTGRRVSSCAARALSADRSKRRLRLLAERRPAKSIDEMNDGVLAEARRRYAGD